MTLTGAFNIIRRLICWPGDRPRFDGSDYRSRFHWRPLATQHCDTRRVTPIIQHAAIYRVLSNPLSGADPENELGGG